MHPKDFPHPAGQLIKTAPGYWAFAPAPLPPPLSYDNALALALSRADAALSELSGLGRYLPSPRLLIAPYSRREAVLSSRIEGTQASLSDILLDELQASPSDKDSAEARDVLEVRNYVAAMELGLRRVAKLPFGIRLVKEIHERLMRGVRGQEKTPGEFRRSQNWIGPAGSNPETAPYVPPPVPEMQQAMGDWEKFVNLRGQMPDLIQCAILHEQFEAIHPFLDGNGRIGRLLITLFLTERGRLSFPLLYLSAYIEAHRQDYYDLLQRVRTHGDWSTWIHFFLDGVAETAAQAVQQAAALLALREKSRAKLKKQPRALELLDELFINPYITVARASELLKVTPPTAARSIGLLQQAGILRETTGRTWGRIYVARPILSAIEHPSEAK